MPDALYLVDGSGFIFRAYHALPRLSTRQGTPTGAAYGFAQMLIKLEQEHRPSHLAVVLDAARKTFRSDLYPEYKAHRPPPPDDLVPQFALVRQVVTAFDVPRLESPDFEADDVIATLTRQARAAGLPVVIVSSDKDLMQLVTDEGVHLLDTMKDVTYGPAEVKEKYGVPPEQLGDVLALMGDSVDNIPGVPNVGPKTAAALIAHFGSLEAMLARASEIATIKGLRGAARCQSLITDNAESARLSRKLVALRDDLPLDVTLDALRVRQPDMTVIETLFRQLEFGRLLDRLRPASAPIENAPPPPRAAAATVVNIPDTPPVAITLSDELTDIASKLEQAGEVGIVLELGEGPPLHAPLVGLGIAAEGLPPAYIPVAHRYLGVPQQRPLPEVLRVLGPLLKSANVKKHIHKLKEAHLYFSRHGIELGGVVGDPELSAYMLDPARVPDLDGIAERCGAKLESRDAIVGTGKKARKPYETVEVATAAAYAGRRALGAVLLDRALAVEIDASGMSKLMTDIELPLARVLAIIERHGVKLDTAHLRHLSAEVDADIRRLESEVRELAGYEINLGSPKQLQELLFEKLGLTPIKKTKTGLSTDAEVLEELAVEHPVAAKIHEHRALAKLKGTYIDAFPNLVDPATGRLHTSYGQAVATTGRLSSTDPNLQNIPIRTELGRRIRRAFIAEPGHLLIAADYSQIELRVVAHLSKDPVLLDAFQRGQDVHTRTAAEVFHVAPEEATPEMRRVAKAINYGLVYGQTDYGLSKVLGIHKAEARQYINTYMERYAGVASFMDRLIRDARRDGGSRTLFGRFRRLPDLESKNRTARGAAERMARNAPIQGTAADLLKLAMIQVQDRLDKEAPDTRMLLTVHDELVLESPAADAPRVAELVKSIMEAVWKLDVPLQVDAGIGENWAEC